MFTAEFIDAARPSRHATGARWFVDEIYVTVAGRWCCLYRAIDQHGQLIDVLLSQHRDGPAARAFFTRALTFGPAPLEVTTDRAPVYPRVIDALAPGARHVLEQYQNNPIEADHARRPQSQVAADARTHASRARAPLPPSRRSCRTCAAAITTSPPTCRCMIESVPPAPNSRPASDRPRMPRVTVRHVRLRSTQQRQRKGAAHPCGAQGLGSSAGQVKRRAHRHVGKHPLPEPPDQRWQR